MFVAFIVQIVFRYLFNFPIGWTSELTVITWLWLVLWGAAFVVKESEEIRFDLIYAAVGPAHAPRHGHRHRRLRSWPCTPPRSRRRRLRHLHEGREDGLSQDPLRLAVLDLPALRRRHHRPLCLDPVASAARQGAGSRRFDHGELRPVNPASPFSLAVMAIVALSLLGLPIGHAMIGGSVLYLYLAGLDMGTAAEQLLNGMYTSYVLLAIPLFILAAEFMNSGSIMDRLLRFCNALVGRFRGGLAQVNVVQSIIFASMSGSALADAAGSGKLMQTLMTKDGKYTGELCRRPDGGVLGHRAHHPALDPAGAVRAGLRHVHRLPVPRRRRPGPAHRHRADGPDRLHREAAQLPGRGRRAAARAAAHHVGSVPRADDAGDPARLPLQRSHHAHGSRGRRRRLRAAGFRVSLSQLGLARDVYSSLITSARITISIGMLIAGALVFNYVITVENIPKTLAAMLKAYELSPLPSCSSRTSCC